MSRMSPTAVPRLTVGLPTYNGGDFLAESIEDLLGQTFGDFELIVSDNASTDQTADVARAYAAADPRVRYVRQPSNIGSALNHNFCIAEARGELFKWASDDDRYAPDLLQRCVDALDRRPEAVLAHAWTAFIDETGAVTHAPDYPLDTDRADVPARLRSLLLTPGGDDIYGVIRMPVLRRVPWHGSYHQADRVFTAQLALWGRFHQETEHLYFRRDHPGRTERVSSVRERSERLDPRRSNRWVHPVPRLVAEYVGAYVAAIARAPLSMADRGRCLREVAAWAADRADPRTSLPESPDPAVRAKAVAR